MRGTSLKVLDSWLDATQAIFLNRYFGTALVSFWFLLYNYLWAVLPTLRLKSVWAFTACLVLGIAATYSISRTPEMAAMEETALNKLRRMLAAYLAELRGEAARGAFSAQLGVTSTVAETVTAGGSAGAASYFDASAFISEICSERLSSAFSGSRRAGRACSAKPTRWLPKSGRAEAGRAEAGRSRAGSRPERSAGRAARGDAARCMD